MLLAWAAQTEPLQSTLLEMWTTFGGWLGAIEQAQLRIGGTPPPMTRQLFDELNWAIRARMDSVIFETVRAEGHKLTLAEALTQARGLLEETEFSPVPYKAKAAFDELTTRELEVLRLLAQGLSNAAIAQALTVTPRTVNAHLTSIYSKLALTSRAETIRFAFEHRLVQPPG